MPHRESLLLTDLYQLAMMQAYADHGFAAPAVFEFFVRKLPPRRGFLMAAGLDQAVEFLETARFGAEDCEALRRSGQFPEPFIASLAEFRFTGDVDALPEGAIFFPDEPVLRVIAPLPQAQLVETRLINLLHFQTVIASKAARMVLAAPGKQLVDFGLRRAHGAEAGLLAARASYVAGFAGTATLAAALSFGIPAYGTMAHSFIQAHDDEAAAFEHFARSRPQGVVLLIDTYDTERAAEKVAVLAKRLARDGIVIRGVRIDSGDLGEHARRVRTILDAQGHRDIIIFVSGGLDEDALAAHQRAGVPIDGYGIGTSLTTAADAPALDCAYKIQEYDGLPRRKQSEGKATWPGRKQVWRRHAEDGSFAGDTLGLLEEARDGERLLRPVMRGGRRLAALPSLVQIRTHAADQLRRLPAPLQRLEPMSYSVVVSEPLRQLAEACDRRIAAAER
jgi:nicotinate phosphoribosyltransferase